MSECGIFQNTVIVSDIDGTFHTFDKKIGRGNVEAVEYFKENGGIFTFATGRDAVYATCDLPFLTIANAPIICSNGANLYDVSAKKLVSAEYIDGKILYPALEAIESFAPALNISVSRKDSYIRRRKTASETPATADTSPDTCDSWLSAPADCINKAVITGDADKIAAVSKYIKENCPEIVSSSAYPTISELTSPDGTKGAMLKRLHALLGREKTVFAVGDGGNDLSMLLSATRAATTADGSDALKKIPNIIVTAPAADGAIADLIGIIEKELRQPQGILI